MKGEENRIEKIVIVGGGPIGNFSAVLARILGIPVVVYEKRESYTREINVKIEEGFFYKVATQFERLGRRKDDFLFGMHQMLKDKGFKVKLNVLEESLRGKAEELGATFMQADIQDYQDVQTRHKGESPLVLDCAGRRSPIRISVFGPDEQSMQIYDLQSAMHVNFKAKTNKMNAFQLWELIYPVFKCNSHLKVGEIVISKAQDEAGYSHVTIPLMIEKELAFEFDQHYPNINREPLRPFRMAGKKGEMPEILEMAISSVFYPLALHGWDINWDSVVIKKIEITCGYAKERSKGALVCLGDSAAHFAYYKSLNIGLAHAHKFFEMLTDYSSIRMNLRPFENEEAKSLFNKHYPLLLYHSFRHSLFASTLLVATKAIIYGAFTVDLRDMSLSKLDIIPAHSEKKVEEYFREFEDKKLQKSTWENWLQEYEKWRLSEIKSVVAANSMRNTSANLLSNAIWLNSLSPIHLSETISYIKNGYFINDKDFVSFHTNLKEMKNALYSGRLFLEVVAVRLDCLEEEYDGIIPEKLVPLRKEVLTRLQCPIEIEWKDVLGITRPADAWDRDDYNKKAATAMILSLQICRKMIGNLQMETGPEELAI